MVTLLTTVNACADQIILHDYFETAEGGGRLCLTLAQAYNADLCYGFKTSYHPFFQKADFVLPLKVVLKTLCKIEPKING